MKSGGRKAKEIHSSNSKPILINVDNEEDPIDEYEPQQIVNQNLDLDVHNRR